MGGRTDSGPHVHIPPAPPARADELARLRKELAREPERHPLRIVISGDPRRPLRTIVLHARWPVVALGLVGVLVLAALGLGAVTWILRRSLGRLETQVTAMTATADHLGRYPLPDHVDSHVESPEEEARPGDLPERAAVKPRAAIAPAQLGKFFVEVVNNGESLEVVLDLATGEMEEKSYRALRRLMRCQRTGAETPIDPRLIELLHSIARRTGQKIQLVSGFRAPMFSTAKLSYHTRGMAADIRIPGMTPLMVRDLVMGMGVKGVGYYPVSQFVHIDVRDEKAYWVDSGAAREETENVSHTE